MDEIERQAIRDLLRRQADTNTRSREGARRWLIEEGLYNEAGELRPQYGGDIPDEPR